MRKDIIRKPLTELTLLDRFLFAEAMENPENMQIVLDIILDNELHLRGKPQTEKELRRSTVYRFAKLDVWAEDMDDTLYDTEVQQENTYNLPKRFRYYQGLIDSQLLHYFEHTNDADGSVQDERILELQRNVKSVQENAEVGVRYMQLWEEMAMSRQDGYDEGREAGHREGYGEGHQAGYDAGQQYERARINALNQKLMEDNRTDDLLRAVKDSAYQEQLLKEYHL